MDRERHEPTLGNTGLADVEFRPRSYRGPGPAPSAQAFPLGKAIVALLLLIGVAMLLIEWNARRQAAAITAELMRPMTARESAQLKAQMKQWERELEAESARELAALDRQLRSQRVTPYVAPAPLRDGQRCINRRRFERIEGGWRDLPHEPC